MKNNSRLRVIGIIIILLFVIGSIFIRLLLSNADTRTSKKTLAEYNDLFTKEAQSKLQILATVETSTRNPVSNYVYDKRFHIKVFKMNLATSDNLDKILYEKNEHTDRISGFVDPMVHNSFFEMSCRTGKPDTISKLNFRFGGDSIQRVGRNDSLICYYLKIGTFAIGYNDDPNVDIWGSSVSEGKIPIGIEFVKKKKFLYFILINVDQGTQVMSPQILWEILKK